MQIGFPETEECGRCLGRGHYFTRLGYPGQDPRIIGYTNIRWQPTTGPHWCEPCNSTGRRALRSPKQTEPRFLHIAIDGTMTHERETTYGH